MLAAIKVKSDVTLKQSMKVFSVAGCLIGS